MRETDEQLRARIANEYGMWGAFLSHVMECSGGALDEAARHAGLTRLDDVITRADDATTRTKP